MKCVFCGAEIDDTAAFCPVCGRQLRENTIPVTATVVNPDGSPASGGFRAFLLGQNKTLLLVLAILVSVSAGVSLVSGGGIPLFPILYTIFLWLIYAKFSAGEINSKAIRWVSGTVFAQYVLLWIGAAAFALAGVIFVFLGAVSGAVAVTDITDALQKIPGVSVDIEPLLQGGTAFVAIGLAFACLLVAGIILVLNLLGNRKIHRFIQSLYRSADNDAAQLVNPKGAAKWMLVFGILEAISAVGAGRFGLLSGGCAAAAYIVGYVIVKKAFVDQAQ